jgi:hypothetical protein
MSQELNQDCAICLSLGDICMSCEEQTAALAPAAVKPVVHRYRVVKMLSEDGNKIDYKPHGPWVVMADVHHAHVTRLQAEIAALQQRLTIADQRVDDLQSVVEQVLTNAERGLPPDLHRTLRKLVPEPASTQPVDEAEREPFEAWHRRRFKTKYSTGAPTRDIHGSMPDPNYGPPNQQQMWEAWNARAALLIPRDYEIPGTSFLRLNALANEGE